MNLSTEWVEGLFYLNKLTHGKFFSKKGISSCPFQPTLVVEPSRESGTGFNNQAIFVEWPNRNIKYIQCYNGTMLLVPS